jgi:CDP-6-deoxy-D-xylo-4-hexulose-3-dehydrase
MTDNITREDTDALIRFLQGGPILTQSENVRLLEQEWSDWLGVRHSVFVNSGSSANLLTMAALRRLHGDGEIIVPPLTWVSDVASVLHSGFKPVFADIDPRNLGMAEQAVLDKITRKTRAVFLTYVLGFNCLTDRLLSELKARGVYLIEDVCESHGASYGGRKLGAFGLASNFSFYYAHHMSSIEGGMICTGDDEFYQTARMLRSHGMVRESTDETVKARYRAEYPDLHPEFIFAYPAYNVRSTELNAVIARNQLPRLDANNRKRCENFRLFLDRLDKRRFYTDFDLEGSVNYAFVAVLRQKDDALMARVCQALREANVEFRRGASGGGNQLRQPYLRKLAGENAGADYPNVDHIHFYGMYIGNYPGLEREKILDLCALLNQA